MLKGKAVSAAKILVTVIAMKREIYPFPAKGTVCMDQGFFLPGNLRKECKDRSENSHTLVLLCSDKTLNPEGLE
jgi:hypothetical protein